MSSKKSKGKRVKGTTVLDDLDTTLLPGRRECGCEASKHSLIDNCLSCGRIVCAQEGSGDCFTCGQMVITRKERQVLEEYQKQQIKQISKVSPNESLKNKSGETDNKGFKNIAAIFDKGLEKAVEHKDKLLEYDENSSVRTKVIDDENDYFSLTSQNWISNEKRKAITSKVEKLHENKLKTNKKILIDLMDVSATDYSEPVVKDFDQQIQKLHEESQLKSDYQSVDASTFIQEDSHKNLPILVYLNDNKNKANERSAEELNNTKRLMDSYSRLRIQDKELMEICDEGMCLSVGQPFASLLVSGVKLYEGRNWYSPFRGRLWIHSNSKKPNEETIRKVEKLYSFAGIESFPTYPVSALVGCVTVTDCLPIEEYRQKYPNSEADDSYIFVCEDPKQLADPIPMSGGGQRIYKLNEKIHLMANKLILNHK